MTTKQTCKNFGRDCIESIDWFEVLQAGVEDPCLHRPENWLMGQLIVL
jgi:hypothetical protein